jgi:hypothetical protein
METNLRVSMANTKELGTLRQQRQNQNALMAFFPEFITWDGTC